MLISKPYEPKEPKYPFTTETKIIYHVEWPQEYKLMRGDLTFTYRKKPGAYEGTIHRNSIPCMTYETIGAYGSYREEILVDLEGNVYPVN
jgi:hypothetical protein